MLSVWVPESAIADTVVDAHGRSIDSPADRGSADVVAVVFMSM